MIFDPVEKIPLASMFGKRPKDLPVNTMMDMELQADEKASMHILSMTETGCTHAQGTSRIEIGVVPHIVGYTKIIFRFSFRQ